MSVKPEYMHPHKIKTLPYRGDNLETDLQSLELELTGRLPNMSKRNVS
jgi:hypothetical protein